MSDKEQIILDLHEKGKSVITIMIHVNAECGLSMSENEVVYKIGAMGLSLPQHTKDKETPTP